MQSHRELMAYKDFRVGRVACNAQGQSTLEYALVLVAILAIIIALSALWHFLSEEGFFSMVLASLAHRIPGVAYEILLY